MPHNTEALLADALLSLPQGAALRRVSAFVQSAGDARFTAVPQATHRAAALQAAASSLVYDVLMLRVRTTSSLSVPGRDLMMCKLCMGDSAAGGRQVRVKLRQQTGCKA